MTWIFGPHPLCPPPPKGPGGGGCESEEGSVAVGRAPSSDLLGRGVGKQNPLGVDQLLAGVRVRYFPAEASTTAGSPPW
jgi:hypothetical protein